MPVFLENLVVFLRVGCWQDFFSINNFTISHSPSFTQKKRGLWWNVPPKTVLYHHYHCQSFGCMESGKINPPKLLEYLKPSLGRDFPSKLLCGWFSDFSVVWHGNEIPKFAYAYFHILHFKSVIVQKLKKTFLHHHSTIKSKQPSLWSRENAHVGGHGCPVFWITNFQHEEQRPVGTLVKKCTS